MDRDSRPLRGAGGGAGYDYDYESMANPFGTGKRGTPSPSTGNSPNNHSGTYGGGGSSSLPPIPTASKPRDPERPLKYNPTGAYDRIPNDFKEDLANGTTPTEDQVLVPCPHCGRKFREDRLEKHGVACKNLLDGKAKRGTFVASPSSSSASMGSPMASSKSSAAAMSPLRSGVNRPGALNSSIGRTSVAASSAGTSPASSMKSSIGRSIAANSGGGAGVGTSTTISGGTLRR